MKLSVDGTPVFRCLTRLVLRWQVCVRASAWLRGSTIARVTGAARCRGPLHHGSIRKQQRCLFPEAYFVLLCSKLA